MFAVRLSKAVGTTYYISVADGHDTNCTGIDPTPYNPALPVPQACPWKTSNRFNSAIFIGGDQIKFHRGEVFSGPLLTPRSGDSGIPIIYTDYDAGALPIITKSGTYTYAVSIRDGRSNITLQNLQFQDGTNQNIMLYNGASNIVIDNVVSMGNFNGINGIGGDFTDIKILNLTFSGIGATRNGVYIVGNNLTNIEIDNVTVSGCLNGIVTIPNGVGTNISITNSDVSDCTNDAVLVSNSSTVNLLDLNLTDNGGRGVVIGSLIDAQINRVTATGNAKGIVIASDATSNNIDISNSTFSSGTNGNGFSLLGNGANSDVYVTNTTSSNNLGGDGFNVHGNWTDVIFDHCVSENNGTVGAGAEGDGFSFHDTSSGIIRYSESKNNKKSAMAHINSAQVDMYYNLFYHATNGTIPLIYLEAGAGVYTLHNNVIYSGGNTGILLSAYAANMNVRNNIIYGGNIGILKGGTGIITEDYNNVFGAFTNNYQGLVKGVHSIEADPVFFNAAGYDFHLTSSSPSIDAGIDLGLGYTLDFDGLRTPVGDPDMGAYEHSLGIFRSSLNQYAIGGIAVIPSGEWYSQTTAVFKFMMDSRDNPDDLTPEVEVRENIIGFTNVVTDTGPIISGASPIEGIVTVPGLISGKDYHWQARFTNATTSSRWISMGGSPDFKVDSGAPVPTISNGVDGLPPVLEDIIEVSFTDPEGNLNPVTVQYGFDTVLGCSSSDYGNVFTSGDAFTITGVHIDYLCVKASDFAGNTTFVSLGQLHTTLPDSDPPTFTVNNNVSSTQTTSDIINVTVNESNLATATVKYAFSADSTCNASDFLFPSPSFPFTSGIDFIISPTHNDYLCLVAADIYSNTAYYSIGRLNVVSTIIIGGVIALAAPVDAVPPCVAVDVQENNAIVKAIDWKFTDSSFDETGFRLYDPLAPSDYVEVANANINQIQLTGLQTNKAYTRVVVAFNGAITSNATSPATCYTLANVPKKPSISQITADSITLKLDPTDGNPPGTKYAIEEIKSHQYVNGSGVFTATPVWQTYEQWGGENGIKVWGTRPTGVIAQIIKMALTSNTEYVFGVMAENGDGFKTDLSETISGSTSGSAPTNSNTNKPPVVPPTNTNKPPVMPPVTPPVTPPVINGNINVPIEPEPGLNENINEQPEIPGIINENINQAPAEVEPLPIPIIGAILEIFDDPNVEQVSQNVVTPALLAMVAISTLPAVIVLSLYLLPYLHLIFLEPLLLLFGKKRKKWGIVYNSLTKKPVDLALVRLYDKKNNQLVQTRVTDKQGRYIMIVKEPGKYFLSITKPGFSSPTRYLKDEKEDLKYLDLYHGEAIDVTAKDAVVTANIPIDPIEQKTLSVAEVIRSYTLKNLRLIISYAGLILAILVVLIIPTLITIGALLLHVVFYLAFRRLMIPPKPKSWGIVYDAKTKEPLGSSVVRIFDLKFNKLLETQVTDSKGRYSFLVGKNEYQMLAEKPGYQNKEVKPVDLVKNEAVVNLDVGLNKI